MPERKTVERARKAKKEGKSPSTQAGEFVREEIEHVREGKHGARSTKQAIAIGLSKARREGVDLPPPDEGETSERTRRQAERDLEQGKAKKEGKAKKASPRRARASRQALEREGRKAASKKALSKQAKSKQAKSAAKKRKASSRKKSSGKKKA